MCRRIKTEDVKEMWTNDDVIISIRKELTVEIVMCMEIIPETLIMRDGHYKTQKLRTINLYTYKKETHTHHLTELGR